ncbi:hypothetical protein PF005_g4490 [Phytophthora fragariae]|uniref:Uncharacterized protein n=1 Tax=Phytophthora fragariae TaxID=53985 RepID=A0A6A3Z1L2_9STRA|nr:hypothetical protein PF003_g12326 [Phytophthora fragariae]KAE8942151.1 hypothetical protein PF009_g8081 [Phytophthora fragariae]KAE9018879.1 hypothetical protein PF011_g6063 [Phytophthora fragariae]KAE9122114.1 hypothetical protein PF007_g7572 [Phytophthora fragariae]KAE9149023.1 hypothetical protein PF006_g6458 [Phytophthora fragariae]
MVSEYEAKRLRRIEENRRQLQALNLPTFGSPQSVSPKKGKEEKNQNEKKEKKRKREVEESPPEPTRRSKRLLTKEDKKQRRKEEKKQLKIQEKKEEKRLEREKRLQRVLLRKLKEEKKRQKAKEHVEYMRRRNHENREKKRMEEEDERRELEERRRKWSHLKDWRLRRKLQAREEKKFETIKKRVKQRKERIKQKLKLQIQKRKELFRTASVRRRIRKRKMEERRQAKLELKEKTRMDRKMMREEDFRSRKRERYEVETLRKKEEDEKRKKEMFELNKEKFPVRRVKNLPYIYIKGAMLKSKEKPAMVTRELYVDVDAFHAFALGRQFLPASKNSVMQALCPSGHTAAFKDRFNLHMWSNAMSLFLSAESAKDLDQLLREAWLDDERCVFFRWSRTGDVTDEMVERLFEIEKGDERLRIDDNYYDPPIPVGTPQPLMLFVQFPQGPYIYCGRLGYLGHMSNGVFCFQLLDINSTCMYWAQLRNILTYWDNPVHSIDFLGYPCS